MGLLDRFKRKREPQGRAPETEEYTPSGSAVYRYQAPENRGFQPPAASSRGAVEKYLDGVFPGWEGFVYHETVSDLVHIDIHVLHSPQRDCQLLCTTGMSDLPMTLPEELSDREDLKYAELYMLLPGDWDLGGVGTGAQALPYERFWPLRMLKFLARFPHAYGTWLGWGHTVPNGPDYDPVCPGLGFGGAVLSQPSLLPPLETEEGKKISFYMLIPAYREEIEYKLEYGMEALSRRFRENGLKLVLDPARPNFCKDFKGAAD